MISIDATGVSILVLMDLAREFRMSGRLEPQTLVSILVLMDLARELNEFQSSFLLCLVSILVLMDLAREYEIIIGGRKVRL
ncbi:hypothetical protein MSMAP_0719 [Methanosarcina mazei SarPi]|uniref:Uncharacterized protein n=1 Tax=Methanosarcina mazei SarPi TaxID=1434115 RepID=A0A0E3R9E9_METMZ|nr:hypothetical protein MSMAP_0719 [Methanosarcina mazei SarPi]